jgi:hypothetical protein
MGRKQYGPFINSRSCWGYLPGLFYCKRLGLRPLLTNPDGPSAHAPARDTRAPVMLKTILSTAMNSVLFKSRVYSRKLFGGVPG